MDRIGHLEEILDVSIISAVPKGESLEKYHAVYRDQDVLLRIYTDDYYSNRFLREGMALRQLKSSAEVLVPRIIDEWPEYQVRAIEWFGFSDMDVTSHHLEKATEWLRSQSVDLPYDLKQDLYLHLTSIESLHPSYRSFYAEKVEQIVSELDWNEGTRGLVHGDFHQENIGILDQNVVVYDWEYATMGSSLYDQAYLATINPELVKDTVPLKWQALVTAVIAHWYLQEKVFSPKEAIHWVNSLGSLEI